ncbi:MAG TPA: MMPL family transporter [Acidimicrobiales bacterium]|nr:MMPL family transporter [Acidimicrobiales bacterium]
MKSLARLSVRHRWYVLVAWIVLFIGLNVAAQVFGSAYSNTFSLPGTNSANAYQLLSKVQGEKGDADQIVFQSTGGPVAAHRSTIESMLTKMAKLPVVADVTSPFCATTTTPCPGASQVSQDGTIAYAVVHFSVPGFKLTANQIKTVERVGATIRSHSLDVQFGGNAFGQLDSPTSSPGEIFGLIATAIVLLFAFGSFLAMLLPLGVALFALGVASGATTLMSHGLAIAQFAPILGSLIGLGVGIDYALFIVTRSRQGLKRGMGVEESIVSAINTSGRAVLFAGSTVCIALLGMLVLRLSFLNGVAISATVTVAITMLASLTLLPSLLAFQKMRVLSRRERRSLAEHGPEPVVVKGGWQRWARFVSRHPRVLSLVALVAIVAMAVPYFSLHLGSSDQGSNPPSSTTRQAYDLLAKGFGPGFNGPLTVVGAITSPRDLTAMQSLATSLRTKPDVAAVSPVIPVVNGTVGIISVVPKSSPQDVATSQLIARLRDTYIPAATTHTHTAIYVGGITAIFDDFATVLSSKIPLFVGVIVLLGCLLLMVAFRSVLVPLVAAAMNLLAAGASFGLVVAVFQWGWGSSLLGAGTGPIESFLPIIMIAILFGLSMDYQVFLVSRMHEEWLNTNDNEEAIIRGQANTGRVITAAALIMISVFLSFAFGGQRIIAEFGIGLGGAVLMDAFILRTVLVPSLMHFLGRANWWMPKWLDRVVPRVAVEATSEELEFT